jgi:hypothetical protein
MTNIDESPFPVPLAEALTPVRDLYAELIGAAVAWQAGRERHTDPDHFALLCVGADSAWDPEATPTRWTRTGAYHLLRCDVPNWCSAGRCLQPAELPEAMWEWFDFLDETGRLHPGADPLCELRKPLLCYGGLDQRGRPLPKGAPSTVVCECFVPYRETSELLGELHRRAVHCGTDPLDPLRRLVGRPTAGPPPWPDEDPDDGPPWPVPAGC